MLVRIAKYLLQHITKFLYQIEIIGMDNYHKADDNTLIIVNHTSLLDGILLYLFLPEKPTFAINTEIRDRPDFKFYLKFVDLFVMDYKKPLSIRSMIKFIKAGNKAVIFPEGRITTTGSLMKIYDGAGLIAEKSNATILPIGIIGAEYSRYSYMKKNHGKTMWFPKIRITVLPPAKINLDPKLSGRQQRQYTSLQMSDLMYALTYAAYDKNTTLFNALINAIKYHGKHTKIAEDVNTAPLSYHQIMQRSLVLAKKMEPTTKLQERVGLLLPNTIATASCFIALSYLNRVPTMLNFSTGAKVLCDSCQIAKLKHVYTSKEFIRVAKLEDAITQLSAVVTIHYLEDIKDSVTVIDKLIGVLKSWHPQCYHKPIEATAPAVVLFTSGSEGYPKGVVLSHNNLLSNYAQVKCHIDFQSNDILFNCLPMFHSFGLIAGFLMPFLGGSKVFFYPTPLHYRSIPEIIYTVEATILFGTNTFFRGYARHAHPYDFNTLRYVIAGAEKLTEDTQQLWMDKFGIRILQGYGVTEASPVISTNTFMLNKNGTAGRFMPNMDYCLEPVEGVDKGGRLLVRGPNIMQGYLLKEHDDIVPAFKHYQGKDWYDTGDVADVDEHGFISILGRAKRFAKIGGEMISLTAVEELAKAIWGRYNHAALNVADEKKGERIILISDSPTTTRKEILNYARQHNIGELFVPKQIHIIRKVPLLGTGKIDYMSLTKELKGTLI